VAGVDLQRQPQQVLRVMRRSAKYRVLTDGVCVVDWGGNQLCKHCSVKKLASLSSSPHFTSATILIYNSKPCGARQQEARGRWVELLSAAFRKKNICREMSAVVKIFSKASFMFLSMTFCHNCIDHLSIYPFHGFKAVNLLIEFCL
jgi:hypothetical protein